MRLYTQFLVVFLILLAAGLGSIVYNSVSQNRNLERIDGERAKEFQQSFQEIIDLKVSNTKNYDYDYSYWDELVEFVSTHDSEWAKYNIDETMHTFGADYVYVVDAAGKMIYRAVSEQVKKDVFDSVSPQDFNFDKPIFNSYFIDADGTPVQVFTAPIQRSNDVKRTGKPYGYLVMAKIWTPEFIAEFQKITKQKVELAATSGTEYDYTHFLKSREGKNLFALGITLSTTTHDLLREITRANLYSVAFVGLIGIIGFGWFIYRRVIVPLDRISATLEAGNTTGIESLSKTKGEFGRIAALVKEFFAQKIDLEHQLRRADEAEKEQRRLREQLENINGELERKVEERTRALEEMNRTLDQRVVEETRKRHDQERLLVQQNRLVSMGEMIGSIAHQWRQPLNTLGLIIQDTEDAYEFGEMDEEYVKTMSSKAMEQINYMSRTIDDFRTFFNPNKEKRRFIVRDNIHNVLDIASAGMKKFGIEPSVSIPETLSLYGYPNEFNQVMLNLLSNARDAFALRPSDHPSIAIEGVEEGGRITLTVTDNAGGIPETILPKIFDPYFTTKGDAKGMGMGLYMSKMIIEEHMNGTIRAENVAGGARFILTFGKPEAAGGDSAAVDATVVMA